MCHHDELLTLFSALGPSNCAVRLYHGNDKGCPPDLCIRKKKRDQGMRFLFGVCLVALALAGCGTASTGANQAAAPPASASTAATPAPTTDTGSPPEGVPPAAATPGASANHPPASNAAVDAPIDEAALNRVRLAVQPITRNLDQPVYATHAGDGSGRLFVVEKPGRIQIVRDGAVDQTPFLDITDRVGSSGSEQGLLSVAFHPAYAENGQLFVNYTDRNGDTVIARFQASGDTADPNSETVLLQIDQPYRNHNGGLVKFGPDGYLYIGMGDGGSAGDPENNGQRLDTLLGKLLRLDVDGSAPYAIPVSNPWADGQGARPEIWAYGLRNPWRFAFDRQTGDLYTADVGQNRIEEVSVQPADSSGGENYGWNILEGSDCFQALRCDHEGTVLPVAEYTHDQGCSITGGYVYRGANFPQLNGIYLFGDYCSGQVWMLRELAPGRWWQRAALQTDLQISSFGEDQAGELYITSLSDGGLYRVVVE